MFSETLNTFFLPCVLKIVNLVFSALNFSIALLILLKKEKEKKNFYTKYS